MNRLMNCQWMLRLSVAGGALMAFNGCGLSDREWAGIAETTITTVLSTLVQVLLGNVTATT